MGFDSRFKGLKQYIVRTVRFIFFVQVSQICQSIIPCLLDWGLWCEGQWAKNLSVRRWMRTGMGSMFRECVGGKWGYVWYGYR